MASTQAVKTDLYIDGAWRAGAEGKRIDVLDPSTGKAIASVADATVEDALAAVTAAYEAAAGLGRDCRHGSAAKSCANAGC